VAKSLAFEVNTAPKTPPVGIVSEPFSTVAPVTVNAPPNAVAPVPTVNVFVPFTAVFPFNVVVFSYLHTGVFLILAIQNHP
jgi:hypothetical protein